MKPEREKEFARSGGKDAEAYARLWWLFGKPRQELRPALAGLRRYIATVETAKHRVFQFLDAAIVPDNMLVVIGSSDPYSLGILSCRIHIVWAVRAGGWLGVGNDPRYSKSRCFDPFPFPATDDLQKQRIRVVTEELDAHRKRVLAEHPHLTLTGLCNVLERLRGGAAAGDLSPDEQRIFDDGLVLILKELHDRLDVLVAKAYGWPVGLSDDDILHRLVALNRERAAEEARGLVRWLRPEYQSPRFGLGKEKVELDLLGGTMRDDVVAPAGHKPNYPADEAAQTVAVMAALVRATGPLDAVAIAATFRGRGNVAKIAAVLNSLYRMGIAVAGADGAAFTLRGVA